MHHRALVRALLKWFPAHARDLPWRRTMDPYAVWVSEIMLQQTQVKTVIPYFNRWMQALPDIAALARCPSARLHKLWEGLGYYTRVRNMQKAAIVIRDLHGGRFPTGPAAILALPGIGRYTAGAICSIAFNQPQPIVDGNVIRVLARCFAIAGNPKDKRINERFWTLASALVSLAHTTKWNNDLPAASAGLRLAGNCSLLNQSLMELGATICTPANPACDRCPVRRHCSALANETVDRFPASAARPGTTHRRFVAFVIRRGNKLVVSQRPAGVVNAHLWEFPNVEIDVDEVDAIAAAGRSLGVRFQKATPLGVIRHSITRYRITMECHEATLPAQLPASFGRAVGTRELHSLAFTAAHQKLLRLVGLNDEAQDAKPSRGRSR